MTTSSLPLARTSVLVWSALVVTGLVTGFVSWLGRSPVVQPGVAGTAAWWPHVALAVSALGWLTTGWVRRTRRRRPALLLLPLTPGFVARWRRTVSARRPARTVAAALLTALIAYCTARIAWQVTGGLDPNVTVTAWGGPGYAGALACHLLDVLLISAAASAALHHVLLPQAGVHEDPPLWPSDNPGRRGVMRG